MKPGEIPAKHACFCFLSSVVMVVTAWAHAPERLPSFEVGSVKRNTSGDSRYANANAAGRSLDRDERAACPEILS